jgi:hypothetical protein
MTSHQQMEVLCVVQAKVVLILDPYLVVVVHSNAPAHPHPAVFILIV